MTFKVQNRPSASAFVYKVFAQYSNHLMSVIYILQPCDTLNGAIKKKTETLIINTYFQTFILQGNVVFHPSYKVFQTHSITELRQLQAVSIEST